MSIIRGVRSNAGSTSDSPAVLVDDQGRLILAPESVGGGGGGSGPQSALVFDQLIDESGGVQTDYFELTGGSFVCIITSMSGDPNFHVEVYGQATDTMDDGTSTMLVDGQSNPVNGTLVLAGNTAMPYLSLYVTLQSGATASVRVYASKQPVAPLQVNPSSERYEGVTILHLETSAVNGEEFVAFDASPCNMLDIVNNSDVDIEYQRFSSGLTMRIKAGSARMVHGITDASQVSVRRVDTSTTSVLVEAEAFLASTV